MTTTMKRTMLIAACPERKSHLLIAPDSSINKVWNQINNINQEPCYECGAVDNPNCENH